MEESRTIERRRRTDAGWPKGGENVAVLELTSSITFLYFEDLEVAKPFFEKTLGLEKAYDPGWACVYRLRDKAFLGAVDNQSGSIKVTSRESVLVSLTVSNLEEAHAHIKADGRASGVSEIKQVKELALKSFFFTGPEGYRFEVEQFTSGELERLF